MPEAHPATTTVAKAEKMSVFYGIQCPQTAFILSAEPGDQTQILDQPVKYFWKESLTPGHRVGQNGVAFDADDAKLRMLARKLREMVAAGIRIPYLSRHPSPLDNKILNGESVLARGRVVDSAVKGNELFLRVMAVGNEGIQLSACNDVSVGVDPDYVDSEGRHWGEAIVHLAATPDPAVLGLGEPTSTLSSEKSKQLILLAGGGMDNPTIPITPSPTATTSSPQMDSWPCSQMCMSRLHGAIDGLQDVPKEGKLDHIANWAEGKKGMADNLTPGMAKMSRRERDEKAINLSRMIGSAADPVIRKENIATIAQLKEKCVAKGYAPATMDALYALAVGDPGKESYNDIALSRVSTIDGDRSLALAFFSVLSENHPQVQLGRQTTTQIDPNGAKKEVNREAAVDFLQKLTGRTVAGAAKAKP